MRGKTLFECGFSSVTAELLVKPLLQLFFTRCSTALLPGGWWWLRFSSDMVQRDVTLQSGKVCASHSASLLLSLLQIFWKKKTVLSKVSIALVKYHSVLRCQSRYLTPDLSGVWESAVKTTIAAEV